jgi:heme-degrading monooxygenase HmoA
MADEPWTLGSWRTREGKEQDFRRAWETFARWTIANIPGATEAFLLQDPNDPLHFVSFGPWQSLGSIADWRSRNEFAAFLSQANDLCEAFQPSTYQLAAHVQAGAG